MRALSTTAGLMVLWILALTYAPDATRRVEHHATAPIHDYVDRHIGAE